MAIIILLLIIIIIIINKDNDIKYIVSREEKESESRKYYGVLKVTLPCNSFLYLYDDDDDDDGMAHI